MRAFRQTGCQPNNHLVVEREHSGRTKLYRPVCVRRWKGNFQRYDQKPNNWFYNTEVNRYDFGISFWHNSSYEQEQPDRNGNYIHCLWFVDIDSFKVKHNTGMVVLIRCESWLLESFGEYWKIYILNIFQYFSLRPHCIISRTYSSWLNFYKKWNYVRSVVYFSYSSYTSQDGCPCDRWKSSFLKTTIPKTKKMVPRVWIDTIMNANYRLIYLIAFKSQPENFRCCRNRWPYNVEKPCGMSLRNRFSLLSITVFVITTPLTLSSVTMIPYRKNSEIVRKTKCGGALRHFVIMHCYVCYWNLLSAIMNCVKVIKKPAKNMNWWVQTIPRLCTIGTRVGLHDLTGAGKSRN